MQGKHSTQLLDGNKLAAKIRTAIRTELEKANLPNVTLATLLVGDNPASRLYVGMKHKQAQAAGMKSMHIELPQTSSQQQVEEAVANLAEDPNVNGILVQLPLPYPLDALKVISLIPPEKDVDGLTENSLGRLVQGRKSLAPCTPLGVMRLLEEYKIETQGKSAVVVGRSFLVGLPQMLLLLERGVDATVTAAHSRTTDLVEVCRNADILICAVGSAGMITEQHVKPGATVFDVGVSRTEQGIRGDVDFESVSKIAGAITPMPGGTGPMTVACLLENTLRAAHLQGVLS